MFQGSARHCFVWQKSKGGLTNGGLGPKFSEKIGGNPSWKIGPFQGKLAPFQGWSGPFRGRSGPIPLHTHKPRVKSRNCPERALFGPIGPFRAKPPFAKPPFGFPRFVQIQKTREGCGCPTSLAGKSFRANFDAAVNFLTDFPAARNAIPAKVWALSGKENSCWKVGRAFGNAAGFYAPRPPQPS